MRARLSGRALFSMSYLYRANLDPLSRHDQLEITRDDGTPLTLRIGHYYELSEAELAQARQHIVLEETDVRADAPTSGLDTSANPTDPQLPVWVEAENAFVFMTPWGRRLLIRVA